MQFSSRFVFFVCAASAFAAAPDPVLQCGRQALAQLPLHFEANQGQFPSDVRFLARAGDYRVYLTDAGATLAAGSHRVDVRLENAAAAAIEPAGALSARTDYFIGSRADWHTGIANYTRVRYRGVYRGIDVVYYGDGNRLEYDFVLQPGANPAAIRMRFDGARNLAVNGSGEVEFDTDAGRMQQKLPAIYQRDAAGAHREVHGRFVLLSANTVGVKVDGYDRRRELVIDPTLVYSSYIGGSQSDQVNAVRLTSNGLLYLTGTTATSDLQPAGNAFANNLVGIVNSFLIVLDTTKPGYDLVYLTYFGGSNLDLATAMQIDNAGRAYITGTTTSTNFPLAGASVQSSGAATSVYAFVTVIDPNADSPTDSLYYSTFLGGTQGDTAGTAIDVDPAGRIYVSGTTKASDFPVTESAYAGVIFGPQDIFLVKIDVNSPDLLYSTFLGGQGDDFGGGIAVGSNGLVYFGANTVSPDFPLAGFSYQDHLNGPEDMIVGVMDMTKSGVASLVYCTYFGGSATEEMRGFKLDAANNILLTGYTLSSDYPITGDAAQATYAGAGDAIVAVLSPLASQFLVYSTYLGGSDGEVAYDVAADASGSLYVTGYTLSPDFPVSVDAYQRGWLNGIEIFVSKIKRGTPGPTALQYSTYLGGASIYQGSAIAVGADGRFYVAGWAGTGLPVVGNTLQSGFAGGYDDGFLVVFQPDTPSGGGHTRHPILRH